MSQGLSPPDPRDRREGIRFLLDLDARLEVLDRAILVADWDLQSGRSRRGSGPWQLKRRALLSADGLLPWTRTALGQGWPGPFHRRLELLERVLLDTQVEQHPAVVKLRSEMEGPVVSFRPRWKGRSVNRAVLGRVLREDPVPAHRRQAYYALEPLHTALESSLSTLLELRNERARALGYASFPAMRLGFSGISPARLEALGAETIRGAKALLRARVRSLRSAAGGDGWFPWDVRYAEGREAPLPRRRFPSSGMFPRVLRAVRQWGFRLGPRPFKVVFHDLPAGGLTLAPDPPRDVRILVHPTGGWTAYMILFHEVGHAVHSAGIRAPRHLLRWHENVPGFGGFHEGIGSLFEEIASTRTWLTRDMGVPAPEAAAFVAQHRARELWGTGSLVNWIALEQALYRHPGRDPMPAFQRQERSLFGYDEYPPLSFVDPFWIDTPVYGPNYLFAKLFHHQLARLLRQRFGEPLWPNRRVGPYLAREWFAPGSRFDWIPRLEALTGERFGADAFRAAVVIRSGGAAA